MTGTRLRKREMGCSVPVDRHTLSFSILSFTLPFSIHGSRQRQIIAAAVNLMNERRLGNQDIEAEAIKKTMWHQGEKKAQNKIDIVGGQQQQKAVEATHGS